MNIFMYYYWYHPRLKNELAGPTKVFDLSDNLVRQGHTVILFAPDAGLPHRQTRARVVRVPAIGIPMIGMVIYNILLLFYSLALRCRYSCDVVYVRIMSSLVPLIMARLNGAPIMYEVNDDPYFRYKNSRGIYRIKVPFIKLYDHINFMCADLILAATALFKDAIMSRTGLPDSKFRVVRSGSNTDLFVAGDKRELRLSLGLDPDALYLGFAGNYNIANDYETFIAAARIVCDRAPATRYLLVGEAWLDRLLPLVEARGLRPYFHMAGHVPYTEVPRYIGAMDIGLAPIIPEWSDISAVKIFDYLACERPAITTKIGSAGDYLLETDCVIQVEPRNPQALADACLALLADGPRRERMGRNGRALIVRKYSRSAIAAEVAGMAQKLLDGAA